MILQPQPVVIIDFSHMYHMCRFAALNAGPRYDIHDATFKNVEGKLRTISRELGKQKITNYELVFAEDRPPVRKLELLATYRQRHGNSKEGKGELRKRLIQAAHNTFCYSEGNEADDVIATLVRLASRVNYLPIRPTIIVTGDRDLWQLIGPTTSVFNPIKKSIVTPDDIHKAFLVNPSHIALVKALWGDAGDCVPNALPRTRKQLLPLVRQTDGSLKEFKSLLSFNRESLTPKCQTLIEDGLSQVEINWQLTKLDPYCLLKWD